MLLPGYLTHVPHSYISANWRFTSEQPPTTMNRNIISKLPEKLPKSQEN